MNDTLKKILAGVGVLGAFGLGGAAIAGAQGDAPAGKPAVAQAETVEAPDDEASEQGERSDGESDQQVSGADADRAGQAALRSVGAGKVLGVERETPDREADRPEPGDTADSAAELAREQESAYSVEVQKSDGSTVEVALDSSFSVLGSEQDDQGAQDGDSASDPADTPAQR